MKLLTSIVAVSFIAAATFNTHAALVSVSGPNSSAGASAAIISAPDDVNDDAAYNTAIQGFDEQQFYTLLADLDVDGGTITAGTLVSSHMIFLNSGPDNSSTLISQGLGSFDDGVEFTFDGAVLGIMSNSNGSREVSSSAFLGATGTIYPIANFAARGLEGDPLSGYNDDWYAFSGNAITLGMKVTEPGDWIRVITAANVSEGSTLALLSIGLLGFIARRRKAKR
jgi:hypothetical protein